MSTDPVARESADAASFACTWQQDGLDAASVLVSGDVDASNAPALSRTLGAAIGAARLVVVYVGEVSFMDQTGVRVILEASAGARVLGRRVVVAGASTAVACLFEMRKSGGPVDMVGHPALTTDAVANGDRKATVIAGRVVDGPTPGVWIVDAEEWVRCAWAPPSRGSALEPGARVELHLDRWGGIDGWHAPGSGLAVDQRHMDPGWWPEDAHRTTCRGCETVWLVPAGRSFGGNTDRCLICTGSLRDR